MFRPSTQNRKVFVSVDSYVILLTVKANYIIITIPGVGVAVRARPNRRSALTKLLFSC